MEVDALRRRRLPDAGRPVDDDLHVGPVAVDRRLDALDRVHLVEEPARDLLVPDRELVVAVRRELRPLHVVALVGHHRVQLCDRGVDVERLVPAVGQVVDLFLGERVAQSRPPSSRSVHECALVPATGRRFAASSSWPGTSWCSDQVDQERAVVARAPRRSRARPRRASRRAPRARPCSRASSSKRISGSPRSNEPGNAWSGEAALAPVLLHVQLQQLVAAVVADDELRADVVARGRPHRLDRVHRAAVAAEADHGLVRHRELDAERAREADAERAAAGRRSSGRAAFGGRWCVSSGDDGQRLVEDRRRRRAPGARARP